MAFFVLLVDWSRHSGWKSATGLIVGGALFSTWTAGVVWGRIYKTPLFLEMLRDAAAASGRRMILRAVTGQPLDHPEVVTIPETGYLKGALLEAAD